jgi:hypothetical protein
MRRALALALAVYISLILFGCGADPVSTEPTRTIEAGWTRYDKADYNFSIDIPSGWKEVSMEPTEVRDSLARLEKEGFEFADEYQEQLIELSLTQLSFFAFDPKQTSFDGADTVVYVQRIDTPRLPLAMFLEQRLEQLSRKGRNNTYVEGQNIVYVTRNESNQLVTSAIDYHVFGTKKSYVVSAVGINFAPQSLETFNKIAASLHTIEED